MSTLPPDLARLRTLETWLAYTLAEVRAAITRAEEQAAAAPVRTLPAGPTWILSYLRVGARPVADSVHLGDCTMASHHTKPLSREQALQALTTGGIRACEFCRPDSDLGILD